MDSVDGNVPIPMELTSMFATRVTKCLNMLAEFNSMTKKSNYVRGHLMYATGILMLYRAESTR